MVQDAGGRADSALYQTASAREPAEILDGMNEQALPEAVNAMISNATVEILDFRSTMTYGLRPCATRRGPC
jgi:hypothetical protein